MKSYHPEELFDENGRLIPELRELAPKGTQPHGREPACQWRRAAEGSAFAGFPQVTQWMFPSREP